MYLDITCASEDFEPFTDFSCEGVMSESNIFTTASGIILLTGEFVLGVRVISGRFFSSSSEIVHAGITFMLLQLNFTIYKEY